MKQSYLKFLFFFIGFSLLNPTIIQAQCVTGVEDNITYPKRDLRGVFVPTLFNISWPSSASLTTVQQQDELIEILDDAQSNGYNSVFLQVRPAGDAFYASTIEPWSHWLSGTEGTPPSPFYDPLEFAVAESHARGLDLHVWLNPYRVKYGSYTTHSSHVIAENPDWTFVDSSNSTRTILNPGLPQVTDYIVSIVEDLSSRYDIDGLHFDDYFYPKNGMANNQDAQTYIDNNPGGLSLPDWRRDNVNKMIEEVYDAIQVININDNKNVVFGVSPFGIWKNGIPSGTSGTSSYDELFCDPIAWMQAGKVDYIAPQVYWDLNSSGQDYNLLTQWWNDQADANNTQLYVSQAYYKMLSPQNWPASEIQGQIDFNRSASMDATFGQIGYRYNEIDNNTNSINTDLNASQFQYKSFAPPITTPGKDAICPNRPDNIRFGPLKIMWDTPVAAVDGDLPAKYVVYAFNSAAQAITNENDGSKILDIVPGNELTLTQTQIDTKFFVVTSLDKNNNEAGDFCNFPLPDIMAQCLVESLVAPTAMNNCSGSFIATTTAVLPIRNNTVITWNYDFGGGVTFTQSQNVVIENDVTEYFTVSGWSNGPPHLGSLAKISGDYSTNDGNIDACACEVTSSGNMTVEANDYLKVESNITVDGILTIAHQGSLVQVDPNATVTNNGSITVKKTTPVLGAQGFMILGSPMSAESRTGVYGSGRRVLNHRTDLFVPNGAVGGGTENFVDDNNNNWEIHDIALTLGAGYLVKPQAPGANPVGGQFDLDYTLGTLNNGVINYPLIYNGTRNASPNMLGNPFASAIDLDAFLPANAQINAVYYWQHITPPVDTYPGFNQLNFNLGDISVYNQGSGGIAAPNGGGIPTQYMASGQGFGVKASGNGNAIFNNSMRVTSPNTDYRTPEVSDRQRIWLDVKNNDYGLISNMLVAFTEEATDGFEGIFDSRRLDTPISLYSLLDTDEELAIQGRSAFNEEQEIQLGFSTMVEESQTYTISIRQIEGDDISNATVYLYDKALEIIANLSDGSYSFTSNAIQNSERFQLLFQNRELGTNDEAIQSIYMLPNPTTGILIVNSPMAKVNQIDVIDIQGRIISSQKYDRNNQNIVDLSLLEASMYFVKVYTSEGTLIKRIIKK